MGIKKVEIIEAKDDLTGEKIPEDTKAIEVTYKNKKHQLFLSEANVKRFEDFLTGDSPLVTKSGTAGVNDYGYEFKKVRGWAVATGMKAANDKPVTETTPRLGQHIYDAYHKEHEQTQDA